MEFKAKGIGGTAEGFDAPAAGKAGGRSLKTQNLDPSARRDLALKVRH
jgi:hypothetical protein